MSDPAILFAKPQAISQRDKKLLRDAGVLVVEIDDPANAKFVRAQTEMSTSAMLLAAMRAIKEGGSNNTHVAFTRMVAAFLEEQANAGSVI